MRGDQIGLQECFRGCVQPLNESEFREGQSFQSNNESDRIPARIDSVVAVPIASHGAITSEKNLLTRIISVPGAPDVLFKH